MDQLEFPGLGTLTRDKRVGWFVSQPIELRLLSGGACPVIVDGYEDDPTPCEFHVTVANLLAASPSVLLAAEPYLVQYCEDLNEVWEPGAPERIELESPSDVWKHVRLRDAMVERRHHLDKAVYVSFQGDVDWEEEHGVQIVFRAGTELVKVGPYDGHLTNSDAYADPGRETVIYAN